MPPHDILCPLPLFVPADRPERIAKAAATTASGIIADLEDAVAPSGKIAARNGLAAALAALSQPHDKRIFVRVNAPGTPWHQDDLAALAGLPLDGLILPKTESPDDIEQTRIATGRRLPVWALIETAAGLAAVRDIATGADRLLFGSIDFAADLACAHSREALLLARLEIVLASRLRNLAAPIDGVTVAVKDEAETEADARYAASLGFGGKLLIHPAQIAPAQRGFAPGADEIAWAERVLAASPDGSAVALDGAMVDAPVIARARAIIKRQNAFSNGTAA